MKTKSSPSFSIYLHLPANFLQVCQWRHCYQVLTAYLFCKSDPCLQQRGQGGLTSIMSRHRHHVTRHIFRASVMGGDERVRPGLLTECPLGDLMPGAGADIYTECHQPGL